MSAVSGMVNLAKAVMHNANFVVKTRFPMRQSRLVCPASPVLLAKELRFSVMGPKTQNAKFVETGFLVVVA